MIKWILFLTIAFTGICNAQKLKSYTFNEAEKLVAKEPRPIIISFYTSWCKYCKLMQKTTFKNPQVIQKLNTSFYLIIFDAESKEEVFHLNRIFQYIPNGTKTGIHEITTYYLKNHDYKYPSTLFLNSKFQPQSILQSYLSTNDFLQVLNTNIDSTNC